MYRASGIKLLLVLLIAGGLASPPAALAGEFDDLTEARLRQLEEETQRLRAELESLQATQPVALPRVTGDPVAFETEAAQPAAPSMDEIRAEMKKLAWTKGDIQIIPYGYLWASTSYETLHSNMGDYTLYVFSPDDRPEGAWHVDGKSTRLGIDFVGPMLPRFGCAQTGGKVEFDFQGAFQTENRGSVLLRHAYVEVKNEYFRLLAGQTWDVISPLLPGTIMYSVGWGAVETSDIGAPSFALSATTISLTYCSSQHRHPSMPTSHPRLAVMWWPSTPNGPSLKVD